MMRNTALATAKAPKPKAVTVVAFVGDNRPNPRKSSKDQQTTMTKSGHEIGLANWSDIVTLRFFIKPASKSAADKACRCAGVCGSRLARNSSIACKVGNTARTLRASGFESTAFPGPQNIW